MKILIINAGSSSLKYQLLSLPSEKLLAKGGCERIGISGSFIEQKANGETVKKETPIASHDAAISLVMEFLTDKEKGVLKALSEVEAIGHRVVHGAEKFKKSVVVDKEVLRELEANIPFAPLHMPANISGIKACMKALPSVKNVAVFDTAFHSTIEEKSFLYGLPYEAYEDWKIRRYGFHGTSHKYVSDVAAKFLNVQKKDLNIITCHLGNGSSITAIKGGISIDTSMGFTPLEGLIMGTRSGDLDPALHEYIMSKTNWSINELTNYLNKKSGVLGISGYSSDLRDLRVKYGKDKRCTLAIDMLSLRIKKYIGSYMAELGRLDAIVFTGGIGENDEIVRENSVSGLENFGIILNKTLNKNLERGTNVDLTAKSGKVRILRICTNEELEIARETKKLVK